MLSLSQIDRVVDKAASAVLKRSRVSRVYSDFTTDSIGQDALLVTIVIRDNKAEEITGDNAVDAIVRIRHALHKSGEERFPIIEFATEAELEAELEADANPEP